MLQTISPTLEVNQQNWMADFRQWLVDEGKSENTIASYEYDVADYCYWFLKINGEIFKPNSINSTDVRHYRKTLLDVRSAAPSTWNRRRATLGMLCSFFEQTYDMKLDRIKKIPRAKEIELAPKWLNGADQRRLLRKLEQDIMHSKTTLQHWRAVRDQSMVGLMMFAGLRISEVLRLRLKDIELSERKGSVTVRDSKGDVTGKSMLSASARTFLREWLLIRGDHWTDDKDYVFLGDSGKPLKSRGVQKRMKALGIHAHALRHTTAKNMVDAGERENVIMKQMRHASPRSTRRYITPSEDELAEAVERGELGKIGR